LTSRILTGNLFQNLRPDHLFGQSPDNDLFAAGLLASMENNLLTGELEKGGEKDDERLVGGIINGRGGEGHLDGLIMNTDQTVAGGPGLDIDGKQESTIRQRREKSHDYQAR